MFNRTEYYRRNNPEKIKEINRKYRIKHEEYFKEYKKKYYKNNLDKIKEYNRNKCDEIKIRDRERSKQWQLNNPERTKEINKRYRGKYRKRLNEYQSEWRKTEKGKANNQRNHFKRRAREKEIINTLTSEEWLDILKQYNYKCAYCSIEFDDETLPERDHVIPISEGGDNTKENIVPVCRSCNAKKYNKILRKENFYYVEI